jgi:hypothetical protein
MFRRILALSATIAWACAAGAEDVAPPPAPVSPAPPPAAARLPDYSWLAATNLPSPGGLTTAALANLPANIGERKDWLRRIRRAAWMPSLEFHYVLGEAVQRPYEVVDQRTVISGTEKTSERSADFGSSTAINGGSGDTDVNTSIGGGTRSSSTRFNSTEAAGLTSYARSEEFAWANEYGVFLTWDLSRFVFQRDEISAVSADMELETFRRSVCDQIVVTYYDLKETLVMLTTEALRDSLPTQVRKERLAYQLDVLTGGAFSRAAGQDPPA